MSETVCACLRIPIRTTDPATALPATTPFINLIIYGAFADLATYMFERQKRGADLGPHFRDN